MTTDYENQFAAFFQEMADRAGEITLRYFRKEISVDDKDDKSPVTQADREIEEALRALIQKRFPGHGIIGEEFGRVNDKAEFVWVIDPIDGTTSFITGKPLFGTIIGLAHNGKPVMGCIDQAFTKERWLGVADQYATHNGKPIKVASPRTLEKARLYAGSLEMFGGKNFENYLTLCRTAKHVRYSCDCYAYGLLAMGWADIVVEQRLKISDIAGVVPIITGAGGYVGDWNMNSIDMDFNGYAIAASSKELAQEVANIMNQRSTTGA